MTEMKADFIKVETPPGKQQTLPVEPGKRIPASDISISACDIKDVDKIAEGLYICFSQDWWEKMEPSELRPAEQITRQNRLSARLRPSFSNPYQKWIKATLVSTGEIIGIAGWMAPGNPIHNTWRITAADFYGWKGTLITEEEFDEMWKGVSPVWHDEVEKADGFRKDVLGDEPHWFLAPLITWPEYQGRGVGKRLLDWAIEQADATDPVTPMYLESAPTAVPVYRHVGFVQQAAEFNYLRRGPLTHRTKAKEGKDDVKQVEVIVEKEVEAAVA